MTYPALPKIIDKLKDLTDVNAPTPQDGDILSFDFGAVEWIAIPAPLALTWGNISGTLSDQLDLQSALDGKSSISHTHVELDITDLDKYTQAEVDNLLSAHTTDLNNPHSTTIANLADTNIVAPILDDVLAYDGVNVWNTKTLTIVDIEELSNVNVISPVTGQVLTYDLANLEWVNTDATAGVTDHTLLTNIGTYTHATIDAHIDGFSNKHTASEILFDDTIVGGGFTEVQSVIDFMDDQIGLRETAASGVIEGGAASQATATTVDVTAGTGEIVDGYTDRRNPTRANISWTAIAGYTILMPDQNGTQVIYADNLGVIQQQSVPMTPTQRRNLIQLAFVNYENGIIVSISQAGILSNEVGNTLYDWVYFTNVDDRVKGLGIKPVTNVLSIWGDSGELFSPGINIVLDITDPNIKLFSAVGGDAVPEPFDIMFASGVVQAAAQTVIPDYYESSPGAISNLIGNNAAIHYVYRTIDNRLVLQLGTTSYGNAQQARDQLQLDRTNYIPYVGSGNALLSAQIYAEGNAPDFNDPNDAAIISTIGSSGTSSGVQVTNYLDLTDVIPTSYVGEAGNAAVVNATETGMEFQPNGLGKLNWIFPYAEGPTFQADDVVKDGDWTMVANKATTDRAAPIAIGIEHDQYDGASPTSSATAKQIIYGNRYTFSTDKFVNGYRIYTEVGKTYDVFSVTDPLGAKVITQQIKFTAQTSGWSTFQIDPILGLAGAVFDLVVVEDEEDPSPVIVTTSYSYITQNNETVPGSGEIRHANKLLTELWISKTDNDTTDRTAMLAALQAGDIIELTSAGDRYSIQAVGADSGTYFKFAVSPAAQSTLGIQTVNFETTAATPLAYMYDNDWWLTNGQISTQGLFIADGSYDNIVADNSAYGTDIIYQEASISLDWDVLAASQGGGNATGGESTIIRDDLLGNGEITSALSANQGYVLDQAKEDKSVVAAHVGDIGNPHSTSVDNLTNTSIGGLLTNDVLTWTGAVWENQVLPAGITDHTLLTNIGTQTHPQIDSHLTATGNVHGANLSQMGDVSVGSLATNDVLTWSGSAWENQPASGGGGGEDYIEINSTGTLPTAVGTDAIVIGSGSSSAGAYTVVIGKDASSAGSTLSKQVAIGSYARAGIGNGNIAIGTNTYTSGMINNSIALGASTLCTAGWAVAIGTSVTNGLANSVRLGRDAEHILHLKNLGNLTLEGTAAQFVQPNFATASLPVGTLGGTVYDTTTAQVKLYDGSWSGLVKSNVAEVGANPIVNMVSLTQAAYDALTPVATTFYVIVG